LTYFVPWTKYHPTDFVGLIEQSIPEQQSLVPALTLTDTTHNSLVTQTLR